MKRVWAYRWARWEKGCIDKECLQELEGLHVGEHGLLDL